MSQQPHVGKPNLREVAKYAKVSSASVSRVLNNVPPISEELRAKVEHAVKVLGYKATRSPSSSQPMLVALIGDTRNTYYSEILAGIHDYADRQNVIVTVVENRDDPDFPERFSQWIARSGAIGLIVCSSSALSGDDLRRIRNAGGPGISTINYPSRIEGIPSIRVDYEQAMGKAASHLVSLRHSLIAYLDGPERAYSSHAKKAGVEKMLEQLGHPLRQDLIIRCTSTVEGGFQAMHKLLRLPHSQRPTAVIASNDLMALGAMHAIKSAAYSIPKDISVVGFDDIAMAVHANPSLTTISPPKFELGARAAQFLFRSGGGREALAEELVVMESPLIVRESSGICPESE